MTKEYIIETCRKYKIENYTINNDLSIDVKGYVDLSNKGLTELPLVFNIVEGNFYCHNNNLTTLKGAPRKCTNFYCYYNSLTSLEGAPNECELFNCSNNNLTNLKGAPNECYYILVDYKSLDLDNEELYVIKALYNYYNNKELNNYLKIRQRNEIISIILDHDYRIYH